MIGHHAVEGCEDLLPLEVVLSAGQKAKEEPRKQGKSASVKWML